MINVPNVLSNVLCNAIFSCYSSEVSPVFQLTCDGGRHSVKNYPPLESSLAIIALQISNQGLGMTHVDQPMSVHIIEKDDVTEKVSGRYCSKSFLAQGRQADVEQLKTH